MTEEITITKESSIIIEKNRNEDDYWAKRILLSFLSYETYGMSHNEKKLTPHEYDILSNEMSFVQLQKALYEGYNISYPEIKEGDIVIGTEKQSADIRIVEGVDEDCILLVNGLQDLDYTLPQELSSFWNNWKILCKKERREDI